MTKMKPLLTRRGTTLSTYSATVLLKERGFCGGEWNKICNALPECFDGALEINLEEDYSSYIGSNAIEEIKKIMKKEKLSCILLDRNE